MTSPAIASALAALAEAHITQDGEEQLVAGVIAKVSPPIYIRVFPPSSGSSNLSAAKSTEKEKAKEKESKKEKEKAEGDNMFESFMSSWTRLVGDPILSKWIVLALGVSVALNGYLLKGIGARAGLYGSNVGVVRFSGQETDEEEEEEEESTEEERGVEMKRRWEGSVNGEGKSERVMVKEEDLREFSERVRVVQALPPARLIVPSAHLPAPSAPVHAPVRVAAPIPTPSPSPAPILTALDIVDRKLSQSQHQHQSTSTSTSSSSSSLDSLKNENAKERGDTRTLEECVDIFENGPRPVSASLALLSDEEVVLLSQSGKIAAYALEKVLGDLERAVVIRRALVCEYFLLSCATAND